jgi:hypothetical protein
MAAVVGFWRETGCRRWRKSRLAEGPGEAEPAERSRMRWRTVSVAGSEYDKPWG